MKLSITALTIALLSAAAVHAAPLGNAAGTGAGAGALEARATAPEGWLVSKYGTLLPRGPSLSWKVDSWALRDWTTKNEKNKSA